jgi:biopolymer transport protein ExbD
MAVSLGPSGGDGEETPMSDINTTPLVDVMLVLLIIFLITVPVVIQTVPVSLPKVRFEPTTTKPENVSLSVRAAPDGTCEVYWGLAKVDSEELLDRAVKKLENEIQAARRRREPDRRNHAGSAYPRRHQHALSVHRRRRLHDAARGLCSGRLHFRTPAGRCRNSPLRPRFQE